MWLFLCLVLWWVFCAISTYCVIHGKSLANHCKSTLQDLINSVLPPSMQTRNEDKVNNQAMTAQVWPQWRRILQYSKTPLGEEIAQHYFQCPIDCLGEQKFETYTTSHHKVIHRLLSAISNENLDSNIRRASYLYLQPNSQVQTTSRWNCYELVVIAEKTKVGSDRVYQKDQSRLYKNTSTQPVVILRITYDMSYNMRDTAVINQPFSSFVEGVCGWLSA